MTSSVPNRGPELLAVNIGFLATALITNLMRCFVRTKVVRAFGVDDWLMVVATLLFIAYVSSSITGIHYGTGRHRQDLEAENYQTARQYWWFCYLFYACTMVASKLSIGCLLLRIAVKKIHLYIVYTAMAISVGAGISFFFVTVFQCKPVSYFWNTSQSGSCMSNEVLLALSYLYTVTSIISDFTFAMSPVFIVMTLQVKRKTKIALIPLLTMGCIASAAVLARIPYLKYFRSPDFLWATIDIALWSTVEQGLAITAGSLAAIKPLFAFVNAKLSLSSEPTSLRLDPYGAPSTTLISGGGRNPLRTNETDLYSNSVDTDLGIQEGTAEDLPRSSNWYSTQIEKINRGSLGVPNKKEANNDSEKILGASYNLSENDLGGSCADDNGMQIIRKKFLRYRCGAEELPGSTP